MEGYIDFYGKVNFNSVSKLKKQVEDFMAKGMTKLHLYLSTNGGKLHDAISAYYYFKRTPELKIYTYNCDYVDSAGLVVYCIGENRYSLKSSSFLFHPITCTVPENTVYWLYKMREHLNSMDRKNEKVLEILLDRVNLEEKELDDLINKGADITTEKAKEINLVTEIKDSFSLNIAKEKLFASIHGSEQLESKSQPLYPEYG